MQLKIANAAEVCFVAVLNCAVRKDCFVPISKISIVRGAEVKLVYNYVFSFKRQLFVTPHVDIEIAILKYLALAINLCSQGPGTEVTSPEVYESIESE
jgi:hypothetical protein